MPIKSALYYYAVCDNCGERADYDEFTAYEDAGQAADVAVHLGWTKAGEILHCPDCPPLGEDEEVTA